uniref:THAP-type domain-containing protein n=1 Tax=Schizaphis graminum TaxID=13262 RepID=A0A2S2P890_SCHGA
MGLKCVICSNTASDNVKLFRFPADENLKKTWMDICSLDKYLVSYRICSVHFEKNNFKMNGLLCPNSFPVLNTSSTLDVNTSKFNAPSCKRKLYEPENNESDEVLGQITIIPNTQSPSTSTTTANRIHLNNVKRPRYIGDLRVEHFISPRRASRNLVFFKNKHNETLNKLKITREKARRLQNKVKSYEDLIKVLEQKNLIVKGLWILVSISVILIMIQDRF